MDSTTLMCNFGVQNSENDFWLSAGLQQPWVSVTIGTGSDRFFCIGGESNQKSCYGYHIVLSYF